MYQEVGIALIGTAALFGPLFVATGIYVIWDRWVR